MDIFNYLEIKEHEKLNPNECISMVMLIRQKRASNSGKNPH